VRRWIAGLVSCRSPRARHELGRRSERVAARFLRRRGYRVLARNARAVGVEIDLICLAPDRRTIVIVEVKSGAETRSSPAGREASPARNLRGDQRHRLVGAMAALVRANGWHDRPRRIDVVTVRWAGRGRRPTVRHHEGAVTASRAPGHR